MLRGAQQFGAAAEPIGQAGVVDCVGGNGEHRVDHAALRRGHQLCHFNLVTDPAQRRGGVTGGDLVPGLQSQPLQRFEQIQPAVVKLDQTDIGAVQVMTVQASLDEHERQVVPHVVEPRGAEIGHDAATELVREHRVADGSRLGEPLLTMAEHRQAVTQHQSHASLQRSAVKRRGNRRLGLNRVVMHQGDQPW
ncbi:MAG: hypothetical protein V3U29_06105 [Phycisphaeraceae bacterium]